MPKLTTDQLRQRLEDEGYFTANLWHVDDVMNTYDCDEETAQEVLSTALENDTTMEQIWLAIIYAADYHNLKRKEE